MPTAGRSRGGVARWVLNRVHLHILWVLSHCSVDSAVLLVETAAASLCVTHAHQCKQAAFANMAIQTKHKLLIFWIIMLSFIAFGAWHSEDMETPYWAMWTVPIIFLFVWLLFDCIFVDDKAFVFDHDYEVSRRLLFTTTPHVSRECCQQQHC